MLVVAGARAGSGKYVCWLLQVRALLACLAFVSAAEVIRAVRDSTVNASAKVRKIFDICKRRKKNFAKKI